MFYFQLILFEFDWNCKLHHPFLLKKQINGVEISQWLLFIKKKTGMKQGYERYLMYNTQIK